MYAGIMQVPLLGTAVEAWDDDGKRVEVGEGNLVVTKHLAMMPLGFLGDDENQTKFKDAYFNQYPNKTVWYHADHSESRKGSYLGANVVQSLLINTEASISWVEVTVY